MKIAVITSTRAEYGLLCPFIQELLKDDYFECHVLVTGTHLRTDFGYTVKAIEEDNIPIAYRIPIMEEEHIIQEEVIASAIHQFSKIFRKEQYDAIVLLGDRYELFGFAIPALLNQIPIIHIHGGECSEGAVDEQIRHAITKMASVHFPSVPDNARRIIQMGENPSFVFAVGALGIDNVMKIPLMRKQELEKDLQIDFDKGVALVTYHPVTLEGVQASANQICIVLDSLLLTNLHLLITMPNSDAGGEALNKIILDYAERYPERITYVTSLGQRKYLSTLKYAKLAIGNSSSGIIETASFGLPTVDIGNRQKGRFAPKNVLHCNCIQNEIFDTVQYALSETFQESLWGYLNPYGDGHTAERMIRILKKLPWKEGTMSHKIFYNLDFDISEYSKL